MTSLYNCRHSGDQYRITKFTPDFDVESSYLCTLEECECPAGHRHTCRHRQMLPKFLHRDAINTDWFYDFDRGGWVQWETSLPPEVQTFPETLPPPPPGITVLSLDAGPEALYNTIADAVGEPRLPPQPLIRRRI